MIFSRAPRPRNLSRMTRLRQRAIEAMGGPIWTTIFVIGALLTIFIYQVAYRLIVGEWNP